MVSLAGLPDWVQRYLPPFQVRAMKCTSLPDKASMALLKLRILATGDFNEGVGPVAWAFFLKHEFGP
jgi:hypothetical protein